MGKEIYIPAIQAKDLYSTRQAKNGYTIKNKNNEYNIHKFTNSFDFSLDLIKLIDVHYSAMRNRKDFSFKIKGKEYTPHIICVKFDYSYKNYNLHGNNVYIANDNDWSEELQKAIDNDHVYIVDNKLIAIQTGAAVQNPCDQSLLGKYFKFEDNKYVANKDKFITVKTCDDLRANLYKNGFYVDGTYYVRWKRPSGMARQGNCLFINEKLYKKMHKWETCGLDIKTGNNVDLAAYEAYKALTGSSIINTMELKPDNFLIINDYESVFTDKVIAVELRNNNLVASEKECTISNSIWDGQSLLDESAFPVAYKSHSMLLLRQRFFKSACFKTKIQKWFADNNITDVSQLKINGAYTCANKIEDIKIITTPSSIKYSKFGKKDGWQEEWLQKLTEDCLFGIVKYEKPTKFFDGKLVQCTYQLLNSLQMSKDEVNNICKPSIDYIKAIRRDPAVLMNHIKYPFDEIDDFDGVADNKHISYITNDDIIYKLMRLNHNFTKTQMYFKFRDDVINSLRNRMKQGKILISGNYSTLLGNGYEMLQMAIGTFNGKSILPDGSVHSTRFAYDTELLGSRNPHICAGNVLLVHNAECAEIDKYFDLSPEVVYVNAIDNNIQQRLNGCDYDSDTMLLTDNTTLIAAAKKNYDYFRVPTNYVPSNKINRKYTPDQLCDLDVKTAENKIGEIVNLSQLLNSIMWEQINEGKSIEECKGLYLDICKLAIMSNIEIDKAKKEFVFSTDNELKKIKNERCHENKKPLFVRFIKNCKGEKLSKQTIFRQFKTTMDYVYDSIVQGTDFKRNKDLRSQYKDEIIPFADIIKPRNIKPSGAHYKKMHIIIDYLMAQRTKLKEIYNNYDSKSKEEKIKSYMRATEIKQDCIDFVKNNAKNETVMYLLLSALKNDEYSKCRNLLLTAFFKNDCFYNFVQRDQDRIKQLVENNNGDIILYGIRYSKQDLSAEYHKTA